MIHQVSKQRELWCNKFIYELISCMYLEIKLTLKEAQLVEEQQHPTARHVHHRSSGAVPWHGAGSHGVPHTILRKLHLPFQI